MWAGDADQKASDFLGVMNVDPASKQYGTIVTSIPTWVAGTHPHHTELNGGTDNRLFGLDSDPGSGQLSADVVLRELVTGMSFARRVLRRRFQTNPSDVAHRVARGDALQNQVAVV